MTNDQEEVIERIIWAFKKVTMNHDFDIYTNTQLIDAVVTELEEIDQNEEPSEVVGYSNKLFPGSFSEDETGDLYGDDHD